MLLAESPINIYQSEQRFSEGHGVQMTAVVRTYYQTKHSNSSCKYFLLICCKSDDFILDWGPSLYVIAAARKYKPWLQVDY